MSLLVSFCKLSSLRGVQLPLATAKRTMSSVVQLEYERDPQPLFTDAETQKLLEAMTQMDIKKVFRKRTVKDNSIEHKFMTNAQVEQAFKEAIEKGKALLRMPPVVQVRKDKQQIISKDPALKSFSNTKFVFTDITFGLRQRDRKVVVRQTDGTLEYANLDTAKRMKQLYFPLEGRKLRQPRMFEPDNLKCCLDEHKYEFVLDRLLVQYEPFEADYHRISAATYQHLNESKEFDALRSTRHFGPMAFFYAWHRCIDDLLYDMIKRDFLCNGVQLIALMYKIHNIQVEPAYSETLKQIDEVHSKRNPVMDELMKPLQKVDKIEDEIKSAIGKTNEDFDLDEVCLNFIEQYIAAHALKKVQLELAVQTLRENNAEKRVLYEGLSKAHGVQLS